MNVSMLKPLSRVVNFDELDVPYGLLTILTVLAPSLARRRASVRRGSGLILLMLTASQKRVCVLQGPPGSVAKAAPKAATRSLPRPERRAQLAAVREFPRLPGAVSVKQSRDISDEPAGPDDLGSDADGLERTPTIRRDQVSLAQAAWRARLCALLEETGEDLLLLDEPAARLGTDTAASYVFFLVVRMVAVPGPSTFDLSYASVDELLASRSDFPFKIGLDLSSDAETRDAFHNKFVGFTKFGKRRGPRARKRLIAWRKRLPTRSRTPTSWHVIVALIVRLVARGHFHPGVFLTLMRATWCRLRVLMTLSVGAARVAQVNPLSAAQRCRLRELSDCLVRGIMLCDALPPRLPW